MKKLNVLWLIGIITCLILVQTGSLAEEGSPTPPPQLEPTPTSTPSADLNKKEELDRQFEEQAIPLSSPPSNSDFDGAVLIDVLPYQQTLDTTGATTAPDDPVLVCGAGANSNTVWYRFTPLSPGLIEVNTFGSNYDTVLAVFTGTRGALNPIICNDDVGIIFQSQVIFEAEAGRIYYVSVSDYGSLGGGSLTLTVRLEASDAIKTRVLEPGDNLIHGFAYHNGYLWASTRTYPARIFKIDSDTLDYQRIVLSSELNDGEDLIAAAGYIWVILYTYPARIIRVNPETLQWQVAITFGSSELSYGGSLEYAFGYLWAGGYDRKIAKIDLSNLTYQVFSYPAVASYSQFHAMTSGGGYLWASAPHSSWGGWYADTVVRINPNNPTEYSTVYVNRPMADDIAYSAAHLYTGAETSPSFVYRFADNLAYNSAYAFDYGSYGIFAHGAEIWSAHIGSPGRTIAFNPDLEVQLIQDLPVGFNNANEIAFDPDGYMYVTAWESPAKIVKFAPAWLVEPFLDLPVEYTNFSQAAQGNYGPATGRVNAWFDHDGSYNCSFTNWRAYTAGGCLATSSDQCSPRDNCYDGHNGTDFQPNFDTGEQAFPVATGVVTEVRRDWLQPCATCRDNLYGNYVLINHRNGYATLYAHLAEVYPSIGVGTEITDPRAQSVGEIGGTGGWPIHLHLGLYYDQNGDGSWTENEKVDPYGWWPDLPADPWPIENRYLWKYPIWMEVVYLGDVDLITGTPSGAFTTTIPVGAISDPPATVQVWDIQPPNTFIENWIFTGLSFLLRVLGLSASSVSGASIASTDFTSPITVEVFYKQDQVRHLNTNQLTIFHRGESAGDWSALPTTVDLSDRKATAQTMSSGYFVLEAPPLCSGDIQEPDDNYSLARSISTDSIAVDRVFDIADDEDWFRFTATQGFTYTLQTSNLIGGADTVLELCDIDGVTLLASDDNGGEEQASRLEWLAPVDGIYFVRVAQAPGSSHGCSATYEISMIQKGGPRQIFLPIILKND